MSRSRLPDKRVIKALFDFYLRHRANAWGLDIESPEFKAPSGQTQKLKVETVSKLLKDVDAAQKSRDWIEIIYTLYKKELEEQKSRSGITGLLARAWNGPLLLQQTMRAIRAYIVDTLVANGNKSYAWAIKHVPRARDKNEANQLLYEKNHSDQVEDIEAFKARKEDAALKMEALQCDQYHLAFFNDYILKNDDKAVANSEESFDGFEVNIKRNRRSISNYISHLDAPDDASPSSASEDYPPLSARRRRSHNKRKITSPSKNGMFGHDRLRQAGHHGGLKDQEEDFQPTSRNGY